MLPSNCFPVVLGTLLLLPTSVHAQNAIYVEFNIQGTITDLAANALELRGDGGEMRVVRLNPQSVVAGSPPVEIHISAKASVEQLEEGSYVRIQVNLLEDGSVAQLLNDVVLFDGNRRTTLGMQAAPNVVPDPRAAGQIMNVIGRIVEIAEDSMVVDIRSQRLEVPLGAVTSVKVEDIDPGLVRAGDKIYVRGFSKAPPMQAPTYYAQFVSIELAESLEDRTE